jgi:hypothetical protein
MQVQRVAIFILFCEVVAYIASSTCEPSVLG